MVLDVCGALKNGVGWKWVTSDDGRPLSKDQATAFLVDALADGKLFLPVGECEGFNHKTGCPGHQITGESE